VCASFIYEYENFITRVTKLLEFPVKFGGKNFLRFEIELVKGEKVVFFEVVSVTNCLRGLS